MNQSISLLALTIAATAAVTANTFVVATGVTSTAAGNAIGVARTDAESGDDMLVDVIGTSVVTAAVSISKGDEIEVAAAGKATLLFAGVKVAVGWEDAGADEPVEVLLIAN